MRDVARILWSKEWRTFRVENTNRRKGDRRGYAMSEDTAGEAEVLHAGAAQRATA